MLLLHGLQVWHWAIGGAVVAAVTLLMLALTGRRLGISTGFENLCALAVRVPYFRRAEIAGSNRWRLPFLGGLLLGGLLSALLGGGWAPLWDLGLFDSRIGWGPAGKLGWMFVGGLFIGAGTRMAGGCTSGHGIFGMSNFERASIVSTVSFMAAGVLTTNLIYRVVFTGVGG